MKKRQQYLVSAAERESRSIKAAAFLFEAPLALELGLVHNHHHHHHHHYHYHHQKHLVKIIVTGI